MKEYQLFIDGQFVPNGGDRKFIEVVNPATEEVCSRVPCATTEEVESAILAAEAAQKTWAKVSAPARGKYLIEIADMIQDNFEMLARCVSEEQGKALATSRFEVGFAVEYLHYMADFAYHYKGEILQSDNPTENIFVFKEPYGVVAGILPWNYPFFLIFRKLAPALVTGNTIVIKPSSETPNNAFEFAKLVAKSSLPKGVFNVVMGSGSVVGNALCSSPKIGLISMTGSVPAGSVIMAAAAPNLTKVSLELGGKAPVIIMPDADLDLAAKCVRDSRVINTGQICNCAERVYVHESVAEAFTAKVIEQMKTATFGNALEDETVVMGPLVSAAQRASVEAAVAGAVAAGAKIALGGERPDVKKGYYYPPTVLTNCCHDMAIMHDEIFGPVLPITTFKTLDEAIEYANDCEFGLASSIFTNNMNVALRAAHEIKFGETYINRGHGEAKQGFHAGWRKSGIGGADGDHGVDEYLQTHVMYVQYDDKVQ